MSSQNLLREKIIEVLEERDRGLLPDEAERKANSILDHIDVYEEAKWRLTPRSNHYNYREE